MNPSLNIKNHIGLGIGLLLIIIALALASRTPGEPTPRPDSALAFVTALHYTPSPPRIETVLVKIAAITEIPVTTTPTRTPTPTPTWFSAPRSNLDLTIDQVFADPGVPWKLVSCCRQAALTPVYDPALNRWCVLVSGSGIRVSDGTQVRLAAFAAVLVPNQDAPDQEHYQMSAAIFGFGNNDPRISTTVDRQGTILIRLQGFDVYNPEQSSEHTIALSPVSFSNHSRIIILTGRANEVIPDTMEY